jgi:hypothetical protein
MLDKARKSPIIALKNKRGLQSDASSLSLKQARKDDALELANLIYDVFKGKQNRGKNQLGQKHANQSDIN